MVSEVEAEAGAEGTVPNPNVLPDPGSHEIVMSRPRLSCVMVTPSSSNVDLPSTMSVADTVNVTLAPSGPVASTVIGGGTVMTGGVVSCTVTVKLPFAELLDLSVA